ncbi:MAG: hypothetical protein I3J02_03345 [Prevotella sp.]|nr:hypothetical protein [Prevotella sp.]
MKHAKLLLSAVVLASFSTSMFAQTSGTYYLYDAANKLFLSRGCNWGAEASPDKYGTPFVWDSAAGTFSPYDWNGTVYLNDGVYVDGGTAVVWTSTASGDGYILSANGKYMTHATGSLGEYATMTTDASAATVWQFMSKADHDSIVAAYPSDNKVSVMATAGLTGSTAADFDATLANYTSTVVNTLDPNLYTWTQPNSRNGANATVPREVWSGHGVFTYSLSNLKPGIYKVSVPAFYRDGGFAFCNTLAAEADPYYVSTAYVKANNEEARIKAWAEDRVLTSDPNSIDQAKAAFDAGKYVNEVYTCVGSDSVMSLTVAVPSWQDDCWFIFGNTTLTYYSDQIAAEDAAAIIAKAQELQQQTMEAALKTTLETTLAAFQSNNSISNYNALSDAVNAAQTSVNAYTSAKAALDGRAQLVDANNFYTAEALDSYYTTPKAKYDAGTLTTAEALALNNPYAVTAYKGETQTNTFLGTAFGVSDYSGVPYLNTWSEEGDEDGSNFLVPFYEYWTSDANSLGDKVLTGSVSGLEPGVYAVSADVRVGISTSKSAPAVGITMDANGGNPVTITGTQIGSTVRYLDNYTVYGTVSRDGVLNVNFNVSGTNVSWLAFQNLKYEKANVIEMDETAAYTPVEATGVVNLYRTIVADVWNTLVLPFDVTADQVKAAFGSDVQVSAYSNTDGDNVNFTATDVITANVPVLIKAAAGTSFSFEGVTVVPGTPQTTGVNWNFVGTYAPATAIPAGGYMFQNNQIFKSDGTADTYYMNGFRAYLAPASASAAKPVLNINGIATAINAVVGGVDEAGNVYNITGQRVAKSYKGIVIKNGKKIINK